MSQAQSHPPPNRHTREQQEGERSEHVLASVPELLSRREQKPPRRSRLPVVPFALGLAAGWALAGYVPLDVQRWQPALAALAHSPERLATLLPSLNLGSRPVLVLGSDVVGGNTDVMFVLQVRDGITRITQVPRDTYIENEQLGVVKANALYGERGVETTLAEVSRLVDTPVKRYLKVNLEGVAKVADALGGVEVDVPKRMYYVDNSQGLLIDLFPGRQVLRGESLMGFLRYRHDEMGDLGRMERQRLVLAEVFRQLARPATLTRLPALLRIAGEDIHTDLTPIEMTQILTAMAHSKLSTERLPGRPYWKDDLSYWMPDSNSSHPSGNGDVPSGG